MSVFVALDSDGTVRVPRSFGLRVHSLYRSFRYDPRAALLARVHALGVGPRVHIDVVRALAERGHRVMVIGADWLQSFGLDGIRVRDLPVSGLAYGKSRALREWRSAYPNHERYVVVDDRPEQYAEGWPGWEFYLPGQFVRRIDEFL